MHTEPTLYNLVVNFGVGRGFKKYFRLYSCNFVAVFDFLGSSGLFLGLGKGSKTVLGSTHVVEQISFWNIFKLWIDFLCLRPPNYTLCVF